MGILEEVNASYENSARFRKGSRILSSNIRIKSALLPERAFRDIGCDGGDHIKVHKEDWGPELRGDEESSAGTFTDETGPWGRFKQDRGPCGRDPVR